MSGKPPGLRPNMRTYTGSGRVNFARSSTHNRTSLLMSAGTECHVLVVHTPSNPSHSSCENTRHAACTTSEGDEASVSAVRAAVVIPEPVTAASLPSQVQHGRRPTVAVVGLGYVGLPTALSLHAAGHTVVGVDTSAPRLRDIRSGLVDLLPSQHGRLATALQDADFRMTADPAAVAGTDAVIICVPTPVDGQLVPDLRALTRRLRGGGGPRRARAVCSSSPRPPTSAPRVTSSSSRSRHGDSARQRCLRGVRARADRPRERRPPPGPDPARHRRRHSPVAPNSPPPCWPEPHPPYTGSTRPEAAEMTKLWRTPSGR